jgi:hypothetical protein
VKIPSEMETLSNEVSVDLLRLKNGNNIGLSASAANFLYNIVSSHRIASRHDATEYDLKLYNDYLCAAKTWLNYVKD